MKSLIKNSIIFVCIAICICSLLLVAAFFKAGFLKHVLLQAVAINPLTAMVVILASLSLMLLCITYISRSTVSSSNQVLLDEIEARKQIEKKLVESNRFLDAIIENYPDIIFVKDLDLRYVRINKATADLINKTNDEVIGATDYDLFSEEEADKILLKDNEVLRTGKITPVYEQDIQIRKQTCWFSTRKFPVLDSSGNTAFIIGIARDITEQKKQQDQISQFYKELEIKVKERTLKLSQSEQRFRSLLENGIDVIAMTDQEGHLIYISPSVKKLIGFTDVEMTSKVGETFLHPDDLHIAYTIHQSVLAEPGVPKSGIFRAIHEDGRTIWVEGTTINLLLEENVNAIVSNYHNITEKIEFEKEKQKLESALIEDKIERQKQIAQATLDGQEKERTAIGMEMHDNISQILGVINLYLGLAKSRPELTQEMVEKSTENVLLCIKEIRKLSKSLVTTNISRYGLLFAIKDLIEDFEELDLKFTANIDELSLPGLDDKIQFSLYRIIQEQLNNIVKHSMARHVSLSILCTGNILTLVIEDDGVGFDTTKKHRGIGLSNMENRVDLLNGTFEIVSATNSGCTLKISFPC